MEYTYAFGGFIASLLSFIWIYRLKNNRKISSAELKDFKRSENGKLRSDTDGSMDVIIVGAGVAGASLAYALGKDGWRVHVIERDLNELDRISAEFLQPGGYMKLIELGLEDCVKGIDASRMFGLVIHKEGRSVKLPFPLANFPPGVTGFSFLNGPFVQNIRKRAASLSNVRMEQGTVTSLLKEKGTVKGVCYKSKTGEEITAHAPLTIVCDGGFSNLRRSLSSPKVESRSRHIGFIMENSNHAIAHHVCAVLIDTPILFYPVGSNKTRCTVELPGENVPSVSNGEMAKFLKAHVAPQVAKELRDEFVSSVDKGNIKSATSQSMPASPCPTPGGIIFGDALNMRNPFTGGGMSVALSDVVLLRDLLRPLKNLNDPVAVFKYLESFYILRKPMACSINSVAALLSKFLFFTDDPLIKEMGYACFDYLCLGGIFRDGMVFLLSGLYPSPLILALELFAMAVFSMGHLLLPFPSPKRLLSVARIQKAALSIIFLMLKGEGIRATFFPWTLPAYYRGPPAFS